MAVILNTSLGNIVIDLHTDLCPLTSKNFLKLCKLKYYNNCLFHDVKKDFIAQTGDPTGTGSGGDSVYKHIYGDQARFFDDEIHPKLMHDKIGTVAMASAGKNLNASQFYITLRAGLDYLDGKHTVFGEVAEGLDTLMRINEAYVDDKGRPYKNIRIKTVDILDDPFDDPPHFEDLVPEKSPEIKPPAEGEELRLEYDWVPMDEHMDPEEIDKSLRRKEAQSQAVVLEMIGDIPEAEVAPPENVLFICKLNPVTEEDDLKIIFSRFGKIISADIIRDYKTGDSLCYGFIEFEDKEACEAAYFKMDNVLIDDRRIHVDFSQSVAKLWTRFQKFAAKSSDGQEQDAAPIARPNYTLKESSGQRGHPLNRYDMIFEENTEVSDFDKVEAPVKVKVSLAESKKLSKRTLEVNADERRDQAYLSPKEDRDDRNFHAARKERPSDRYANDNTYSDAENRKRPGLPLLSREGPDDKRDHWRRNKRPRESVLDDRATRHHLSSKRPDDMRHGRDRNERPRERNTDDRQEGNDDTRQRDHPSLSGPDDGRHGRDRNEWPRKRNIRDRQEGSDDTRQRDRPSLSGPDDMRHPRDRNERPQERNIRDRQEGIDDTRKRDRPSRSGADDLRHTNERNERPRERKIGDREEGNDDTRKRDRPSLSGRDRSDARRDYSGWRERSPERNSDEGPGPHEEDQREMRNKIPGDRYANDKADSNGDNQRSGNPSSRYKPHERRGRSGRNERLRDVVLDG